MVWFRRTLEGQGRILSVLVGYLISWDFCVIETFAAITIEEDGFITKDIADKFVHFRFFEFAAVLMAIAVESCGSSNLVLEKVTDISIVRRNRRGNRRTHRSNHLLLHRAFVQGYMHIRRPCSCRPFDWHHVWHLLCQPPPNEKTT